MPLSSQFDDALVFASRLHAIQVRKGTSTPYIAHLLGVCSIALEQGADEDEAIAALLHDAPEDQGGRGVLAQIQERYGARVADIVAGCTDTFEHPKPAWRVRKEAYIRHIPAASRSVRLVSASDKLYNAQAILSDYRYIGEAFWQRFTATKSETLWYYRALTQAYRQAADLSLDRLVDELDRVVTEIEHLTAPL